MTFGPRTDWGRTGREALSDGELEVQSLKTETAQHQEELRGQCGWACLIGRGRKGPEK